MARIYRRRDRPRDVYWYADYTDAAGNRQRDRVSPVKKDAQEYLNRKLAEVAERKLLPHRLSGDKRFHEWCEYYLLHVAPTLRWRVDVERILRGWMAHLGDVRLREITAAMIQERLTARRRTTAPATTNRALAVIRRVLNLAVQHGELDRNPCQAIKALRERNGRVRFLSIEEAQALVDACSGVVRAIVLVALNTGGRKSEILNLRWQDVEMASKTLTFMDTKNSVPRRVPMNDVVVEVLKRLARHGEYVFMEPGRRVLHLKRPFANACARAGLTDVTLHTLRHSFVSHAMMAGLDPRTIAHIVGHKSLTMVMRYSHIAPAHATRAIERVRLGEPDRIGEGAPAPKVRLRAVGP